MKTILLFAFSFLAASLFLPSTYTNLMAAPSIFPITMPTPVEKPTYTAYKGVTIGMKTDDARTKLGVPKDKSDEQDYFEFSERESVQVYYNATSHTVTAVMVTYTGKLDGVPTPKDIFGEDVQAKPDGGIFKKVDYPKAGFWISYTKTGGDDPMIILALNKM
jgi:hypothetical protein